MSVRDLIIVGAGPSGLSAAIAAKKRGLDYQVLEQGVLVNSIYRFPPQMVFFTTPELLEIGGLPFVSPYEKPTRAESLKYYRKVVDSYDLQIAFEEKVLSIQRENGEGAGQPGQAGQAGSDSGAGEADQADAPFEVETRSSRGVRRARLARYVILAIGYYDHPVMLGVPGEDLPHVHHYYGEPHPHYQQRVVIVGGGNSAAESALEMFRAGAHVTIVHRAPTLKSTIKYWVRPDIENRIKEGSIAARFGHIVKEIRPTSVVLAPCLAEARTGGRRAEAEAFQASAADGAGAVQASSADGARAVQASSADGARAFQASGLEEEVPADAVYLLTGYRADTDLMVRAGVQLTDRQGPVCDPVTFETNVPGLFVAGGAIAGVDTGTIFIENGRFHGEKIVEVIARRG
jgi:bacillithiol disulfide reductase